MAEPDDLADAFADPYRVACPRGHTALDPSETTATAFCRTCARSYSFDDLVDKVRDDVDEVRDDGHDPRDDRDPLATPAAAERVKCDSE